MENNNNCSNSCGNANNNEIKCVCGCGCVGYGYVPVQELDSVYTAADAIMAGTVFPELNLGIDEYGYVCRAIGGLSNVKSR